MKYSNDITSNRTRDLLVCSVTACPLLSTYLTKLSLTQMVEAMPNVHFSTARVKRNGDTVRRSFSVVSVSGEPC
jgi:hypothetical protein